MSPIVRVVSWFVLLLVSVASFAQDAPNPAAQSTPVGSFVGRYLDSSSTSSFQSPIRTFRTDLVKASPSEDLLYFTIGSTFVGQKLSTFASRVGTEAKATGNRGEKYLAFDHWYRREPLVDGQDVLKGFDWDDRGYKYVCYTGDGLVILDDDFQEVSVTSWTGAVDAAAFSIGETQYVLAANGSFDSAHVLDVTTPASPTLVRTMTGADRLSRSNDGHIAVRHSTTSFKIYTLDALASGGAAAYTYTPPANYAVLDVTTDGTNFYLLTAGPGYGYIHKLVPSGDTYTSTQVASDPTLQTSTALAYGGGYLTAAHPARALIYEVDGDGLYSHGMRLTNYPYGAFVTLRQVVPVAAGGQNLLVVAADGLGDVFTVDTPDSMTLSQHFSPEKFTSGNATDFTITIDNPRSAAVTFDLADEWPAALKNTDVTSTTCSGSLTAAQGTSSFSLTGATLAAHASCLIRLVLTSSTPGKYFNTIPAGAIVSSDTTNTAPSTATVEVVVEYGPPPSLTAFATSPINVSLSWIGVAGATYYQIYRNNQPLMTVASSFFSDSTVQPNTSYVYKVRAGSGGEPTAFSPPDLATTIFFTDVSLTGLAPKAVHITQLRTAVNAVRTLAALPAATFTDDTPTVIKAAHVLQLRAALDEARAALSLAAMTYTNMITAGVSLMKAVDVIEVRRGTQ